MFSVLVYDNKFVLAKMFLLLLHHYALLSHLIEDQLWYDSINFHLDQTWLMC